MLLPNTFLVTNLRTSSLAIAARPRGRLKGLCGCYVRFVPLRVKGSKLALNGKKGSLLEADEGSMRVERVRCPRICNNPDCEKDHPNGRHRLLHRRFMCILVRGRWASAKFYELPAETCKAGGGSVPTNATECASILSNELKPGPYTMLTDGSGAYQSLAPLDRQANYTDEKVNQWSSERFDKYYKRLKLSHGIVSHSAEQWAVVDRVKTVLPGGRCKTIKLKKGTQVVDGLWPEMRSSVPSAVHTSDWPRCQTYIWAWA